ncbi:hypothetical protein VNI00_009570 [Paramarasmius palmivorus]|uniref:Uncharacterized protein n=1 Tax=Paramarasmius palmivorus TaxID=297713 RepID=A0AAW0CNZ2_9AGAR
MGGFALYDGETFCGYLWNDGDDVNLPDIRNIISAYHRKLREAIAEIEAETEGKEIGQATEKLPVGADPTRSTSTQGNGAQILNENSHLLEYLLKAGHIRISENEITGSLSHSDSITKAIAVIQTTWFLLQVVARAAEGLAITELEIVTVGFAVLNFGTYFLWWNKPLRVRYPVRVYWRQQGIVERTCNVEQSNPNVRWIDGILVSIRNSIQDMLDIFRKADAAVFNLLFHDRLNDQPLSASWWFTN